MDRQLQQKLQLESEIRLLEKQKRDISFSLEQLESTHKEAYSQNTQIIKDLTKRKDELLEQVERLKEGTSTLTDAYEKSKKSLEDFKNHTLQDVEKEVKQARIMVRIMTDEALAAKRDAEKRQFEADIRDQKLEAVQKILDSQATELADQAESLEKRLKKESERKQKADSELAVITEMLLTLQRELEILKEQKAELTLHIRLENEKMDKDNKLLEEKFLQLEQKEKALHNRTTMLEQKQEELQNKEKQINDRAQTLNRSVDEMRRKGATI